MKRLPQLQRLSDDHHHGLVLARHIEHSLLSERPDLEALRAHISSEYASTLDRHFALEERHLLAPVQRAGRPELASRVLADHRILRSLVQQLANATADDFRAFAHNLELHIRFEEREFFEIAQAALREDELNALAADYPRE